jgi:hypothetical protein
MSATPWNANSLEPFALDVTDPCSYFQFDSDSSAESDWISGQIPSPLNTLDQPISKKRIRRSRKPYGYGVDARRTAKFRKHNITRSWMYHYLEAHYHVVTKDMLLRLVNAVVESIPEHLRPQSLTRSEKRVKAGLMLWIDGHAGQVLTYLSSHHLEQ